MYKYVCLYIPVYNIQYIIYTNVGNFKRYIIIYYIIGYFNLFTRYTGIIPFIIYLFNLNLNYLILLR